MKLWVAKLFTAITEEYGVTPFAFKDKQLLSSSMLWASEDGQVFARYWLKLRKLIKYPPDSSDPYSYKEYIFYSTGEIAQISDISHGRIVAQYFDKDGSSISFENYLTKDLI